MPASDLAESAPAVPSEPAPSPLAHALQQLGAKRVEAALVASLAPGKPLGTRDIVASTGLRQPEVSVGMQELRARNWVAYDAVPHHGKGRPMHRYRLVADLEVVRSYYEAQARALLAACEEALNVLRRALGANLRTSTRGPPPGASNAMAAAGAR